MNHKTSIVIITIAILLALMVGSVGAKDIVISNGISLSDTVENQTSELKQVVPDLKVAPVSLVTKVVSKGESTTSVTEKGIIYSISPVMDVLVTIESPDEKALYKAEYISKYANIVGNNTVTIDGSKIELNIISEEYDATNAVLVLNLISHVNGVEKRVINPYKIYNPPITVVQSPAVGSVTFNVTTGKLDKPKAKVVENPSSAVLVALAKQMIQKEDGEAVFGTGDPTLVVYATVYADTERESTSNALFSTSFANAITGAGTAHDHAYYDAYMYQNVITPPTYGVTNGRGGLTFNTSGIVGGSQILSASVNIHGFGTNVTTKDGTLTQANASIVMYVPASNTTVANANYQTNKTGAYRFAEDIPYANWYNIYNRFPLTSSGISMISKDKYTNMQFRLSNDTDSFIMATPAGYAMAALYASDTEFPYITMDYIPFSTSDFTVSPRIGLKNVPLTFTPVQTIGNGTTFNWSFGDGSWANTSSSSAVTHTYTTMNIYSPSLYRMTGTTVANYTTKDEHVGIDSMKVYPSVDGYVSRTTAGTFAAIRAGAGTAVDSSSTSLYSRLSAAAGASDYSRLDRGIEIYDTTDYPGGIFLTNASLNLYGNAKTNGFGTSPNLVATNVTTLASLTSIAASDYDKASIYSLSSSNITYASYNTAAYNKMYLKNDTTTVGIMNLTGLFPLMLRTSWDADNAPPAWVSSASVYFQPLTYDSATTRPYLLLNFSAIPLYFVANTTVGMVGANGILFNDTSTIDGYSYNWSFGDNTYATTRNVTHEYLTQGLFSVNFTSPYPSVNYTLRSNYINISAPSFTCTPTSGAAPLFTTCTDNSAVLTGNVQWIWGDGDTTNGGTTQSHTYAAGTYSPQLQSPVGVGAITTNVNYIGSGVFTPVADFTSNVTSVAAGGYVQFNDTSTYIPTQWRWSFSGGTGSDSVLQNPTYQFNTVGNFSVNLTASNIVGNSSIVKPLYIRVYPAGWVAGMTPITSVDFTVTPYQYVNLGGSLTFAGTVTGGTATSYKWDFVGGTGANATTVNPTYAFTPVGNRTVNFTAYNAISSATMRKVDYIQVFGVGNPYAQFIGIPTSGAPGILIAFTDLSLKGNTTGEVYNWSFGDSGFSSTPYSSIAGSVNHVYTYGGVYDVNLSIMNFNGSSYMFKQQYISVSISDQKLNALYMHETRINVVDSRGAPIGSLPVTAQMMNSSVDGTNWFSSLFGITSLATPIEGTLVTGMTDSKGSVVFTVAGSGLYELRFVDATRGINTVKTLHPSEIDYTFVIPTTASAAIQSIGDFITGNLSVSSQGANVYLNMTYNDTGLQTTNVNYFIVYPNQTIFYTKNFAGTPALNQSVTFGYPVTNTRGDSYVWGYSATNSRWGMINRSQGITLKGVDGILFNPFVYKDRW